MESKRGSFLGSAILTGSACPDIDVGDVVYSLGLHHLESVSMGPYNSLLRFSFRENFLTDQNDRSFIRDKWCHLISFFLKLHDFLDALR